MDTRTKNIIMTIFIVGALITLFAYINGDNTEASSPLGASAQDAQYATQTSGASSAGGDCCSSGSTGSASAGSSQTPSTPSSPSSSGGSSSKGGCCGGGSSGGKKLSLEEGKKLALNYYFKKFKDKNVTAKVEDYGCHVQVNIYKDGKLVKALAVRGADNIQELN